MTESLPPQDPRDALIRELTARVPELTAQVAELREQLGAARRAASGNSANEDPEFSAAAITAEEFEQVWQRATQDA